MKSFDVTLSDLLRVKPCGIVYFGFLEYIGEELLRTICNITLKGTVSLQVLTLDYVNLV